MEISPVGNLALSSAIWLFQAQWCSWGWGIASHLVKVAFELCIGPDEKTRRDILMATTLHSSSTAVVGYFVTGSAAHQAIDRLVAEGFSPSEIGAAFHVGAHTASGTHATDATQASGQPDVGGSLRADLGTTQTQTHLHSGGNFGGPTSTDNDVQVAALGGGAGAPFAGAGKPGPISGSSLANSGLPSELKSSMPHDPAMPQRSTSYVAAEPVHSAESAPHHAGVEHESWTEKLKHVFSPSHTAEPAEQLNQQQGHAAGHIAPAHLSKVTKESQDFGTGEGHLLLPNRVPYSQPAFESSFAQHGVQPDHSRYLSERIGHGGAIVTINTATRAAEAERILESAGGEVRFSASSSTETAAGEGNLEVFGTFDGSYPRRNV